MIPARGNYEAHFQVKGGSGNTYTNTKCIEAFDDEGHALVVDDKGRLVRANSYSNFTHVDEANQEVAGVLPGGGWTFAWTNPDGSSDSEPVVGWIVNDSGYATPLTVDDPNVATATPCSDSNVRVLPPGHVS